MSDRPPPLATRGPSTVLAAVLACLPAGLACAQDAPASTHAQWINAPHSNEMVWPAYAFRAHISGHVQLECTINDKGTLRPCAVVEDTPEGQGFAHAAISFLDATKMRPPMVGGVPVQDAHVQFTIDFDGSQGAIRMAWRSQ